jgi:hypothetical protein
MKRKTAREYLIFCSFVLPFFLPFLIFFIRESGLVKAELSRLCGLYNPVRLQHNINKAILACE